LNGVVQSLINHGATDFYTGGALGFDTLAALTVLRLRHICPNIRLHLILPCKTQTKMWNERDKFVYEQILLSADSVEYVQESYTSGCMHERNRRLVDSAELCVAYCEHSGGGTAYTVAYALKNEKELINIADLI
jgi:uncharacterized phage-like protein YoqJ